MSSDPTSKLYTATDLARWSGVSRQAVSKAGLSGVLRPSKVGRRYNVLHPACVKWLEQRGVDVDDLDTVTGEPAPAVTVAKIETRLGSTANDPLAAIEDMTIRELTDRYGTKEEFLTWTKLRKELAVTRRQELLLARLDGALIPVAAFAHVVGYLESLSIHLLRDVSTKLAHRLASGRRTPEEATSEIRSAIGDALRVARDQMERAVRESRNNPEGPLGSPPDMADARERRQTKERQSLARRVLAGAKGVLRAESAPRIAEYVMKRAAHEALDAVEIERFAATVTEAAIVRITGAELGGDQGDPNEEAGGAEVAA